MSKMQGRNKKQVEIIFKNIPILFMMEMNHLRIENAEISKTIHLQHKNKSLKFSLLGYSVYSSIGEGHFFSYLLIISNDNGQV